MKHILYSTPSFSSNGGGGGGDFHETQIQLSKFTHCIVEIHNVARSLVLSLGNYLYSPKPWLSVSNFVSQLWRIRSRKPGFEATTCTWICSSLFTVHGSTPETTWVRSLFTVYSFTKYTGRLNLYIHVHT